MSNDLMVLKQLAAQLNNPLVTGAVVETDGDIKPAPDVPAAPPSNIAAALDKAKAERPDPAIAQAAAAEAEIMRATMTAPISTEPVRKPAAKSLQRTQSAAATDPTRVLPVPSPIHTPMTAGQAWTAPRTRTLFFTGAPRAGKSWLAAQLGARVFEFSDPIAAMAADVFGTSIPETDLVGFFNEVYAWGEGVVNQKYPLTACRAAFVGGVRDVVNRQGTFGIPLAEFGTSGFWIRSLVARVAHFRTDFPTELVAVTDVGTQEQYQALREAGFSAFHVSCNNITRSGRGGNAIVNPVADSVGRSLTKEISMSPRGPKLWCVWNDPNYSAPSGRLLSVNEFLKGFSI